MSLEEAGILIEGAEKKSMEMGKPMCTAVTDESGHLIAFTRMDGAKVTSIAIAMDKAFTASCAQRQTKDYNEIAVPGKPTFGIHATNQGRFSIIAGGIPIKVGNTIVGSIGISGGTADEDQLVALASIEYFKNKTKLPD